MARHAFLITIQVIAFLIIQTYHYVHWNWNDRVDCHFIPYFSQKRGVEPLPGYIGRLPPPPAASLEADSLCIFTRPCINKTDNESLSFGSTGT
jgi:hypothetical protein